MKTNATLINTSRGTIVNDNDLCEHLKENPDFSYATDVYNNEPSVGQTEFNHAFNTI